MSHNPNSYNNYNDFVNSNYKPDARKPSAYHDEEIYHSDSESHLDFYDNPNNDFNGQQPLQNTYSDPFQSELNTNKSNPVSNQYNEPVLPQHDTNNINSVPIVDGFNGYASNNNQGNYRVQPYPNQLDYGQTHAPSSPFADLEMGKLQSFDDNESIILDLQGDEYPINSFLRKNGTMSNPYRDNKIYHDVWIRNEGPLMENDPFHQVEDQNIDKISTKELDPVEEYFEDDEEKNIDLSSFDKDGQIFSVSEDLADTETDFNNMDDEKQKKVSRRFILENGNFVFDCPIGSTLINQYYDSFDNSQHVSNEFKFMRYQAVTCQPHEFLYNNFVLRQQKFMIPRVTELMIVITMYNEDDFLLGRTLKGVFQNIRHMLKKTHSKTWGPDAWKKIVVTIVSDGRSKINQCSGVLSRWICQIRN